VLLQRFLIFAVEGIEEHFKGIQGMMASFGDGAKFLNFTSSIWRGVASSQVGNCPVGRGLDHGNN
jgi:hypothetical protein